MNKRFLVTAGPTIERIDPVRYLGNFSTGKMGFAIAEELAEAGAEVILIAGPVPLSASSKRIQMIRVESAQEMYEACISNFPHCHGGIMTAAVADYTPVQPSSEKVKRSKANFSVELRPNPDIAASLGKMKSENQLLIGFALETNDELDNARRKLAVKNLDFIILNSLNDAGAGFGYDTNKVSFLDKDNNQRNFELKSKREVAKDIVNEIISLIDG